MKQDDAARILQSGENVFLTGAPGAGKTYVLNRFITNLRNDGVALAITAPTGIAATHIGGMTLHSWSGLGIRDELDETLLERLLQQSYLRSRFEKTKVLIIDEVSMLTPGLFRAVDAILRNVRFNSKPFGGIQVVLTGDFFQLPPVQKDLSADRYVWQTETWQQLAPTVCYLSEQHRQRDTELVGILKEMRQGSVSAASKKLLHACRSRQLPKETATRLYTHNADVDVINRQELEQLDSESRIYTAELEGGQLAEKMLNASLIMPILELKTGAKVIFIKNNFEAGYVNGTLGQVTRFDQEAGWPVITVSSGREIISGPQEWSLTNERGKKLAAIRQVPLRLAWALTVHKSQGMTLDAAEIDLSKAFEPGHGYVALSRIRDLNGLKLLGFNDIALEVDRSVLAADFEMQVLSRQAEERACTLPELKQASPLVRPIRKPSPSLETAKLLEQKLSLAEIAALRDVKVGTIIKHLERLLEGGEQLPLAHVSLDQSIAEQVLSAAAAIKKFGKPEFLSGNGEPLLKPIFEALGGKIDYDQIRLVLLLDKYGRGEE